MWEQRAVGSDASAVGLTRPLLTDDDLIRETVIGNLPRPTATSAPQPIDGSTAHFDVLTIPGGPRAVGHRNLHVDPGTTVAAGQLRFNVRLKFATDIPDVDHFKALVRSCKAGVNE